MHANIAHNKKLKVNEYFEQFEQMMLIFFAAICCLVGIYDWYFLLKFFEESLQIKIYPIFHIWYILSAKESISIVLNDYYYSNFRLRVHFIVGFVTFGN